MAFVEQDIEAQIATALDGLTDIPVLYRNQSDSTPASLKPATYVEVVAHPRRKRTTNSPICDIQIEVYVVASDTECKDADYVVAIADPIINQIDAWETNLDGACDALSVDLFRVDGLRTEGGEIPSHDTTNKAWFARYDVTISGVIQTPVEE